MRRKVNKLTAILIALSLCLCFGITALVALPKTETASASTTASDTLELVDWQTDTLSQYSGYMPNGYVSVRQDVNPSAMAWNAQYLNLKPEDTTTEIAKVWINAKYHNGNWSSAGNGSQNVVLYFYAYDSDGTKLNYTYMNDSGLTNKNGYVNTAEEANANVENINTDLVGRATIRGGDFKNTYMSGGGTQVMSVHGNTWLAFNISSSTPGDNTKYQINGADTTDISSFDGKLSQIAIRWNECFDYEFDIGDIWGETSDGQWVKLFTPKKAKQVESLESANANEFTLTYAATTATYNVTVVDELPLYNTTNVGDWGGGNVADIPLTDISAYNGIKFYVDNTINGDSSVEVFFNKYITAKDTAGADKTWYDNRQQAIFYPDEGDAYQGNSQVIPAGFKGYVVIPFSAFSRNLSTGEDLATIAKIDLTQLVQSRIGISFRANSVYSATTFKMGEWQLVKDAKSKYEEYRFVENELGDTKYINIVHTGVAGTDFTAEILLESNEEVYHDSNTTQEIEEYESLIAGITSEEEFNKKYTVSVQKNTLKNKPVLINGWGEIWGEFRPTTTYTRVKYDITFDEAGGEAVADQENRWGATLNLPTPVRAGYTFTGWTKGGEAFTATEMPTEDLALTATWTANTNTVYTVKHLQQNIANDDYTVFETETPTGTTDTQTNAVAKTYTGFGTGVFTNTTIAGDGSTVIEIKYDRVESTYTFYGLDLEPVTDGTITARYGASLTAPVLPNEAGYTYGWYLGTVEGTTVTYGNAFAETTHGASNISVYLKKDAQTVNYTVKHLQQNIADNNYTEVTANIETLEGLAGASTNAVAKTYTGFGAGVFTNATIAGDGSTVIEIKYDRVESTYTFYGLDLEPVTDGTITARYGASLTAPTLPNEAGYTYGWYLGTVDGSTVTYGDEFSATLFGTESVSVYLKKTAMPVNYTVKHLQQNITGTGYTEVAGDRQTLTGVTGLQTSAVAKTYTGFGAGVFTNATIAGDGSTVIEIKYDRVVITLTVDLGDGSTPTTTDYRFGATVAIPANPTREGYIFAGWTLNGETVTVESLTAAGNDITLLAAWTTPEAPAPTGGCSASTVATVLGMLGAVVGLLFVTKKR